MTEATTTRHDVKFLINEKEYTVSEKDKWNADSKLVDFIREDAKLKGTKIMCREGGCGACVVTVYEKDQLSGNPTAKAVPSCTIPLFNCDGWEIRTVEYLGDKKRGYHPIEKSLVDCNAIQCGFCTPGMVMSMYSLQESKSVANIEDILDGNVCRCTGYRSILDSFKSLGSSQTVAKMNPCEGCPGLKQQDTSQLNTKTCSTSPPTIELDFRNTQKWIKVENLESAFCVLKSFMAEGRPYRVITGINEQGAFKEDPVKNYLDVTSVQELGKYSVNPTQNGVFIGSTVTLASTISILKRISATEGYEYAGEIVKILVRDANVPVRNVATVGEELLMKNKYKEYVSDVFVCMEAVGATVTIAKSEQTMDTFTLLQFFNMDMTGKLLIRLNLPRLKNYFFRAFKISRRYQNCKAILNAGILMKVDKQQNFKVVEKPRIVFGGVHPNFVHAWSTEMFLLNKSLSDEMVLLGAMKQLDREVNPNSKQGEPSPFYRKSLTKSLLYKTILGILGNVVRGKVKSGSTSITIKSNKGKQMYEDEIGPTPLYKSAKRQDAEILSSGEGEFIDDTPLIDCELFGAFVLATVANSQLESVDASAALKMDGVVRFIVAKDIPGDNNNMAFGTQAVTDKEPIFVFDKVEAAGQPIGLILATSRQLAYRAAKKVKVTYKNVQKPIVKARDSLRKVEREGTFEEHVMKTYKTPVATFEMGTREISGEHEQGSQFHYSLETQSCLCIPKEDSMDIFSATQWMDHVQGTVAAALGVQDNYLNIKVKRVGGAFGSKITKATPIASACAVAAFVTNRPVRVIMDLETNMRMIGKREPFVCRYNVKFSETGKIVKLKAFLLSDSGWTKNEAYAAAKLPYFQNLYAASDWEVKGGYLLTNTPSNTYTRAPGGLNGTAFSEYIMEHIAFVLKMDPFDVRAVNYLKVGDRLFNGDTFIEENLMPRMVEQIKITGNYELRKIATEKFNRENSWKKRGLAISTSANIVDYGLNTYVAYVTIYHQDGSVAVSHSGIEFGTGVNIKVAQTVATYLDVPLEKVTVKPNTNLTGNNAGRSALSISSELNSYAAMRACKILVERLAPLKAELPVNTSFQQLVEIAFHSKVDLSASFMFGDPTDHKGRNYVAYQVVITEVEVDILTGEYKQTRVDILQDVGRSLNPLVDIGQVEGGYVFGAGMWTTEEIIFDENNGQLLTYNTWSYKPPETKDIPEDFRVALLSGSVNTEGVLQTKASGEPPTNLGVVVLFAVRKAIESARKDVGNEDWFQMNGPVTFEEVFRNSLVSSSTFMY